MTLLLGAAVLVWLAGALLTGLADTTSSPAVVTVAAVGGSPDDQSSGGGPKSAGASQPRDGGSGGSAAAGHPVSSASKPDTSQGSGSNQSDTQPAAHSEPQPAPSNEGSQAEPQHAAPAQPAPGNEDRAAQPAPRAQPQPRAGDEGQQAAPKPPAAKPQDPANDSGTLRTRPVAMTATPQPGQATAPRGAQQPGAPNPDCQPGSNGCGGAPAAPPPAPAQGSPGPQNAAGGGPGKSGSGQPGGLADPRQQQLASLLLPNQNKPTDHPPSNVADLIAAQVGPRPPPGATPNDADPGAAAEKTARDAERQQLAEASPQEIAKLNSHYTDLGRKPTADEVDQAAANQGETLRSNPTALQQLVPGYRGDRPATDDELRQGGRELLTLRLREAQGKLAPDQARVDDLNARSDALDKKIAAFKANGGTAAERAALLDESQRLQADKIKSLRDAATEFDRARSTYQDVANKQGPLADALRNAPNRDALLDGLARRGAPKTADDVLGAWNGRKPTPDQLARWTSADPGQPRTEQEREDEEALKGWFANSREHPADFDALAANLPQSERDKLNRVFDNYKPDIVTNAARHLGAGYRQASSAMDDWFHRHGILTKPEPGSFKQKMHDGINNAIANVPEGLVQAGKDYAVSFPNRFSSDRAANAWDAAIGRVTPAPENMLPGETPEQAFQRRYPFTAGAHQVGRDIESRWGPLLGHGDATKLKTDYGRDPVGTFLEDITPATLVTPGGMLRAGAARLGAGAAKAAEGVGAATRLGRKGKPSLSEHAPGAPEATPAPTRLSDSLTAGGPGRRPAVGPALTPNDLSPSQRANLNRYSKKLPAAAETTNIRKLPNNSIQFETRVPGRVPGSYALYTKTIDEAGVTVGYTKKTVLPDGSVAHVKDKLAPGSAAAEKRQSQFRGGLGPEDNCAACAAARFRGESTDSVGPATPRSQDAAVQRREIERASGSRFESISPENLAQRTSKLSVGSKVIVSSWRSGAEHLPNGTAHWTFGEKTPEGMRYYDRDHPHGTPQAPSDPRAILVRPANPGPRAEGAATPLAEHPPLVGAKPRDPNPREIQNKYGIRRKDQERFQKFANEYGVTIDVRPVNPLSLRHLRHNQALPKPESIKSKTVNKYDAMLDPRLKGHEGKVGYFHPGSEPPPRGGLSEHDWNKLNERYDQRVREYGKYKGKMEQLRAQGKVRIKDGVVQGFDPEEATWKPYAGDNDIYDIRNYPSGERLPKAKYDKLVGEMQRSRMGVNHGAHKYWEPEPGQRDVYDVIIANHAPGGEPLVRFQPQSPPTLVDGTGRPHQ